MLGTLLATWVGTAAALAACELATVAGAALLFLFDPAVAPETHESGDDAPTWWHSARVLSVLAVAVAATVTLTGTELAVVATLRGSGHDGRIGWMLAVWALGSAAGGLAYGVWHRPRSPYLLLLGLGVTALPLALPLPLPVWLVVLVVSGLACAPTITATVDTLSRVVPPRNRGEALGWHGSALTAGTALGAPVVGMFMDSRGPAAGFVVSGLIGIGVALTAQAITQRRKNGRISYHA